MSGPNVRRADIMEVPKHWDMTHFRAETRSGRKFVYCPVGNICSWSEGDYDHRWCHWCQGFFGEKVESLLNPDEHGKALA